MGGHPGQAKTLELVSRGYYWPSMKTFVNRFVDECDLCQRTKTWRSKPHGLLKPLPVPKGPWQSISYDFITDLPKSNGFTCILVVVDRMTKMAHFIPTVKDIDAKGTARLMVDNVWRLHGTPVETVSDRGTQFNNAMMKGLYTLLRIKPNFSTGIPPSD